MSAEIKYLDDFRPELKVVESKVADLDNGYTRIANELYEELIGSNLTRNQAKVAHAICRKTYGFNKKTDRISDSQLAELTRLPRQKVNKAKNELIAMKVIVKSGSSIGPNKNLTEWEIPECHQNGVTVTKTVTKSVTKSVTEVSPKQGHTKDTITKEKKESNTPLTPQEVKGGELTKPSKRKTQPVNYDEYLNAYNEEVGDRLPHAVEANEKRKTRIRKIIKNLATQNVDGWRAYVRAFVRMAKPFYFGENNTGWTADIDYLLRDTTLTGVREGKFADRGF
ncbi:phage replication protein O, N-terminal domain [Providencia rettgeri]|uniref:replication protein n=1 Tax=Providencia rettgeri TaxID=587 RepID=UPI001EF574C2|nr:replication protein [Providencia rettgeri]CAB5592347.1 phage replication protein O, N-terminal domain [Providencia rettgeri]CAC9118111.1 phage replication protein O, N-terminal domain [Providencia rettgeri]